MNATQIEAIFHAQVDNVRELERAWKHVNRDVNEAYYKNQESAVSFETKLLSLLYCALAEAVFSKLIHTPNGFSAADILQIKRAQSDEGVRAGWTKCIELALLSVNARKSNHGPNVKKKLHELIELYIFDPSILRNKIAHGQWVKALNRDNDAVNNDITAEIASLTVVELYRRKHALEMLVSLVEDLIKSPNKAHQRDYWSYVCEMESAQKEMASWTVENKVEQLLKKRNRATGKV